MLPVLVSEFSISHCFSYLRLLVLIAFQIIRSQRQVKLYGQGNHLIPVLVVVIESAAIYSAVLTSLVTVYLLNSNAQYLILDFSTTVVVSKWYFSATQVINRLKCVRESRSIWLYYMSASERNCRISRVPTQHRTPEARDFRWTPDRSQSTFRD